jgi:hypothetical protein
LKGKPPHRAAGRSADVGSLARHGRFARRRGQDDRYCGGSASTSRRRRKRGTDLQIRPGPLIRTTPPPCGGVFLYGVLVVP